MTERKGLRELRATWAFVERNFNLARRYLGWEVVFLIYTIVNGLTIALIGKGQGPRVVLYLVIGALFWEFLSVLFHEISESIAWERWEGTIEFTFMAPIHRVTHLLGSCVYAVFYALLRVAVVLFFMVVFFHISLRGANLGAALVVLIFASLSFVGMGLAAAVLPLLSTEKGSQATHIFQAVVLLVSGVYYEISALPAWVRPLSAVSPGTYALRAARKALLHGTGVKGLWPELMILLLIGVILVPAGLAVFRWGELHAMRTGKLKRNG
ncbi:MAG: ABC transporter permease [Patescibacteria group bacterium]